MALNAESGRGIALRIEIDDQHLLAHRRERGAEIDRGRGLPDPALLIGDGQDAHAGHRVVCGVVIQTMASLRNASMTASGISQARDASAYLILQDLVALGQFLVHILAFHEQSGRTRLAAMAKAISRSLSSGATARAVTIIDFRPIAILAASSIRI